MKILSVPQIRAADTYTIAHEPISSNDLMERAAAAFTCVFVRLYPAPQEVHIYCGTGNNGGDGLCIARQLALRHYDVKIFVVWFNDKPTTDFSLNLQRVQHHQLNIQNLYVGSELPHRNCSAVVIDALLGSGITRPITTGFLAQIIDHLNNSFCPIIAVDMPSGLLADAHTSPTAYTIKAQQSITFELPKLAFLMPENHLSVGEWQAVSIGLDNTYLEQTHTPYHYLSSKLVKQLQRPLPKFAHKGTKGHVLVMGGSYGKIGACVMAAQACLQIGSGLCTAYLPTCGYNIMQTNSPEVMTLCDPEHACLSQLPEDLSRYQAIAVGTGIGTTMLTQQFIEKLLEQKIPLVIDADALNIIAQNQWQDRLCPNSILTPHPKEFERLVGRTANHFERLKRLREVAELWQCVVVLKGAHTAIACPDGTVYFNSTGNPYMGTGGSGDILTGIIAGLLAQQYPPNIAALLGVFYHGQAADRAILYQKPLRATDILRYLSAQ